MSFSNLTIVNVDGRRGEHLGAQLSLVHSARELPGARALLLSPERPARLLDEIRHISIAPLGYFDYGLFIIYALHRFIQTDFALIVQDDGWVLSGSQWRDAYWKYDYIGAPIHFAKVSMGGTATYVRKFEWVQFLGDPRYRVQFVMNGGFSLRSKKLLQAPSALSLPYILPPVADLKGPPFRMHWASDSYLEDVHLCIDMRAQLERAGLLFAPLDVARTFAFEHLVPAVHESLDFADVLGHHSSVRKFVSIDPLTVRIKREALDAIHGETFVAELFRQRGYTVELF